jgi:excisionase family DNA binding protein
MTSQTYATRRRRLGQEDGPELERLLTPAEVAAMFRVDPKTVTRWARAGKLSSIRTLGGHRRYREAEVHALLAVGGVPE